MALRRPARGYDLARRLRWPAVVVAAVLVVGGVGGVMTSRAGAAIVTDGDFEAPVIQGRVSFLAPSSLDAWTVETGGVLLGDATQWAPASGSQSLWLWNPDGGGTPTVSQIVAVQPGQRYHLSLSYADGPVRGLGEIPCSEVFPGSDPLQIYWGGQRVATLTGTHHLTDDWQRFSTLVTAGTAATPLKFTSPPLPMGGCPMVLDDVALSAPSATETATTLEASSNPSVAGEAVTFIATVISGDVNAVPSGNVQFGLDGAPHGSAVALDSSGRAELRSGALGPGTHTLTAKYTPAGGSTLAGSEALPLTETVTKADATTSVVFDPDPTVAGQRAVVTATVAPKPPSAAQPTGIVQFSDDRGTAIGGPQPLDAAGKTTVTVANGAGSYPIYASYGGDANFNPGLALASRTVNKADTTTTISSSANPVAPGDIVDFTVAVRVKPPAAVAPFGALTFTVNGVPASAPIPLGGADGVVITAKAPTTPETDIIGVSYSGDRDTNPSGDQLTQIVAVSTSLPAARQGSAPPPAASSQPAIPLLPAAAASPTATTVAQLTTMTRVLVEALRGRGLAALTRTDETLSVAAAGTLDQKVYTPKAPTSASATRRADNNILVASASHGFSGPGTARMRLRPTAVGRRLLGKSKSLRIAIVTRFTPNSGMPVVTLARLTAKAKASRHKANSTSTRTTGWRVQRATRRAIARSTAGTRHH